MAHTLHALSVSLQVARPHCASMAPKGVPLQSTAVPLAHTALSLQVSAPLQKEESGHALPVSGFACTYARAHDHPTRLQASDTAAWMSQSAVFASQNC